MIDEKTSERIINNLSKYLRLTGKYDAENGMIYATIQTPYESRILKTIAIHYNVRSFIKTSKTMNNPFILVVF